MEDAGLSMRPVRRRRSAAEKRWIVEQTLVPGASVARVAQAHGVNANVVFHWRRQYQERKLSDAALIPVAMVEDAPAAKHRGGRVRARFESSFPVAHDLG